MRRPFHASDAELLNEYDTLCKAKAEANLEDALYNIEQEIVQVSVCPEWRMMGAEEWDKPLFRPFGPPGLDPVKHSVHQWTVRLDKREHLSQRVDEDSSSAFHAHLIHHADEACGDRG